MGGFAVRLGVIAGCAACAPPKYALNATVPEVFAPKSDPAASYAEPIEAPPQTPFNMSVTAAMQTTAQRVGRPAPMPDARLFRAGAELAEIVPEQGVLDDALVQFALQRQGVIAPLPQLVVVWGNNVKMRDLIVEQLSPRFSELLAGDKPVRFGSGVAQRRSDGSGAIVFVFSPPGVELAPIPRALAAGATLTIDGVLDPPYREPEVVVTRDDGSTERPVVKPRRPGGFTSEIACGPHAGRQQIELHARSALADTTVLANIPVWCAAAPPRSMPTAPRRDTPPVATADDAERRLLASVQRDRAALGRAVLVVDERLAQAARAHSEEMRGSRALANLSPTTGTAIDRARAAHVTTRAVTELVDRASSVRAAYDDVMGLPSTRETLLSPALTHIGIGVALGDEVTGHRELFVTQMLMRVPPTVDRPRAIDTVRDKLTATRAGAKSSPPLFSYAQAFADRLAAGEPRDVAYQAIKAHIDALGRSYRIVDRVITVTDDLEALDGAHLFGTTAARDPEFGIGIAQGTDLELGDNAIWVVVLVAERRTR
jgi:uncharacterized protein YkwD